MCIFYHKMFLQKNPRTMCGEILKILIRCLSCGGRRGNPAWFSARFRPELEALSGDTGGRAVLQRHLEEAVLVPAAPEELEDIDLPLVTGENLQYNRGRKTSE